jgi:hypothetical protein
MDGFRGVEGDIPDEHIWFIEVRLLLIGGVDAEIVNKNLQFSHRIKQRNWHISG